MADTGANRPQLRNAGFSDRAIWDIGKVAGFVTAMAPVAAVTDTHPNVAYHSQAR
jgi:alkylhydroperoxidase family enzyme